MVNCRPMRRGGGGNERGAVESNEKRLARHMGDVGGPQAQSIQQLDGIELGWTVDEWGRQGGRPRTEGGRLPAKEKQAVARERAREAARQRIFIC
jgi:hypothetical protein